MWRCYDGACDIHHTLCVFDVVFRVCNKFGNATRCIHSIGGGGKFKVLTLEVQHKYADFLKMSESSSGDIGI